MSSVNPVFILQEKLITEAEEYAKLLAASINSSTGQFCTCPGIIVGINNDSFNNFIVALSTNFSSYAAAQMLNQGIFENYQSTMQSILQQHAVQKIEIPKAKALPNEALPALAMVNAQDFILNPSLMQEVFGPFCLMVKCTGKPGNAAWRALPGYYRQQVYRSGCRWYKKVLPPYCISKLAKQSFARRIKK